MARRALTTTTAAFATTAALLLTACGGSDDKSSDDIKGADKGSSSPSASASATAGGDGPDLVLPKDFKLVFDFDKPSDAKHSAALADAQNYMRAMYHGIVAQDPEDPAYQYYSDAQGAQYVKSQIQAAVKGGWTITGTDKYYDAETTTLSGGITVAYTNDSGSRDVQVDYIQVNGQTRQSESQSYNTGLYANGSCGGGANSEWMHCNGAIGYGNTP